MIKCVLYLYKNDDISILTLRLFEVNDVRFKCCGWVEGVDLGFD